jgi:hypothetical protein
MGVPVCSRSGFLSCQCKIARECEHGYGDAAGCSNCSQARDAGVAPAEMQRPVDNVSNAIEKIANGCVSLADEIEGLYSDAQDAPCTCGSDPEGSCPHCNKWAAARISSIALIRAFAKELTGG